MVPDQNPGLNSGLMIPQYTQAGLLNEMRILSTPASIDNTPTCGNQEDYVAMGYNATKKRSLQQKNLNISLPLNSCLFMRPSHLFNLVSSGEKRLLGF